MLTQGPVNTIFIRVCRTVPFIFFLSVSHVNSVSLFLKLGDKNTEPLIHRCFLSKYFNSRSEKGIENISSKHFEKSSSPLYRSPTPSLNDTNSSISAVHCFPNGLLLEQKSSLH